MQTLEQEDADQQMSPSIYAGMVDSLFMNPLPMVFGAFGPAIAGAVIGAVSGDLLIWLCVPLFVAVGVARAFQMYRYKQRQTALTYNEAVWWEKRYRIGALVYGIALGLWSVIVLLRTDDAAAHMLCTTTVVAYMSAGVGRTFGRPRIFHLQILLGCGPLSAALIYVGGAFHIAVALLSAVFFIAIRQLTSSLQRIYLNAWVAREREAALANQFDTALNNMPHGLCMFGGTDGRLAVMNHRFTQMMRLPLDLMHRSGSATEIVKACVEAGTISAASGRLIVSEIDNALAGEIITVGFRDHRRACVLLDVPADDRRRHRGFGRGHHRTTQRRGAHHPSRPLRRTHRTAQPGEFPRRDRTAADDRAGPRRDAARRAAVHRSRPVQAGQRYAGPPLRRPAVVRCRRLGCAKCCGRRISSPASAATSSWCSSSISDPTRTRRCWRAGSSTASANATSSITTSSKSAPASASR